MHVGSPFTEGGSLMRQRILSFLAVVAVVAGLMATSPVPADANHSWGNYHWARTTNTFTLKLGDNVSSAWDAYLDEASSDWSQSSVLDTTKVPGGTNPGVCQPTNGRVEICNATYGNTGWLGLTQIRVTGEGHITSAAVKMNDTYFDTARYNTPAWRRSAMCHEVGHTFGLDHQDEASNNPNLGSCMDYTNDPDGPPSNEHPNQHDYDQLVALYAHTDRRNSYDDTAVMTAPLASSPSASDEGDGTNQSEWSTWSEWSEWGRTLRFDAHGRPILHERDLGGDQRLFTWVFWTLEAPGQGWEQHRH